MTSYVEGVRMEPKQRQFSVRYSVIAIAALLLIEGYLFAPRPETLAYRRLRQAGEGRQGE